MVIRYKAREARKAEERHKAFEAVFSDPELDLEEVAAQVNSQSPPYMCATDAITSFIDITCSTSVLRLFGWHNSLDGS